VIRKAAKESEKARQRHHMENAVVPPSCPATLHGHGPLTCTSPCQSSSSRDPQPRRRCWPRLLRFNAQGQGAIGSLGRHTSSHSHAHRETVLPQRCPAEPERAARPAGCSFFVGLPMPIRHQASSAHAFAHPNRRILIREGRVTIDHRFVRLPP
jgi:hypothetical protein